jgi:hypothetical protein
MTALVFVLYCPVYVQVLRRADLPSKEAYQMSTNKVQKTQEETACVLQEPCSHRERNNWQRKPRFSEKQKSSISNILPIKVWGKIITCLDVPVHKLDKICSITPPVTRKV